MVGMIISNGEIITEKKHKVSHKKLEVNHLLTYTCPYCKNQMVYSINPCKSAFHSGYEIWE
jgi:hypothetical protein